MSIEAITYTDEQNRTFAHQLAATFQSNPDYFVEWENKITQEMGEAEAWKSLKYGACLLENFWQESPEMRRVFGYFDERSARLEEKFERHIDPNMWAKYPKHGYIYIVESAGFYKIGRAKQLDRRLWQFRTDYPLPVYLIWSYWTDDATKAEINLHRIYSSKRVRGEWFDLGLDDLLAIQEVLLNG